MDKTGNSIEVAERNTKTVDQKVADRITRFLREWLHKYFYDGSKEEEFNATAAAKVLGLSQPYLSQIGRRRPGRRPGLSVVLRLREQTGATFEEITGQRAPVKPPRPFSRLSPDSHIADDAATKSLSPPPDEPSSSTWRTQNKKRGPRDR